MRPDFPMAGTKVLVADDDEWISNLLVRVLSDAGYRAHAVENGISALDELMRGNYDLAILDVQMPGIGAVEIARRQRLGGKTVPIIVLTADATAETAAQCRKEGVQMIITKPVRPDDLLSRIEAFVNRSFKSSTTSPRLIPHSTNLIDSEVIERLTQACGHDFVRQLIRQFNQQAELLLANLETAYLARNFGSVEELLHRLEGSAGTMGASDTASIVRQLRDRMHSRAGFECMLDNLKASIHSTLSALNSRFALDKNGQEYSRH